MESKKLKIAQIYQLKQEISSLLSLKINQLFKLELLELFERCNDVIVPVEKVKTELITEYLGEIPPGTTEAEVEKFTGFPTFKEKFNELLGEEREISYNPIDRKYIDFEGDMILPQIYSLVKK